MKNRQTELEEAIKLIGWTSVYNRIKSLEDRKIFEELQAKFDKDTEDEEQKVLNEHSISFYAEDNHVQS